MNMFSAAIVMNYLLASAVTAFIGIATRSRKLLDLVAIAMATTGLILSISLMFNTINYGVSTYMFGGFRPPLGVVYYADFISSSLSLLSSFATVVSIILACISMDQSIRRYFYPIAFLLIAGVHSFLFTGDIFHLYVATELVTITSCALTAIYSDKRNAIRATLIYGIAGTAITSFLLLSVILVYGSYGTVNIADIALKSIDPKAVTPFSGGVFGEIVSASITALAMITWVFLFKSGIMPTHFWLPRVYRSAPIASLVLFTSSSDILGVYGILRIYRILFSENSVITSFRNTMLFSLTAISTISAFLSALLTARQDRVRGIVAYSTITQLSLALAGVISRDSEAVAGGLLHISVNALGDTSILTGYTIYMKNRDIDNFSSRLAKVLIMIGFLNLFGLIPIVPGFWSKALMTKGFLDDGNIVGVATVLISTGLCAIGYFRFAINILLREQTSKFKVVSTEGRYFLNTTILLLLIAIVLGLGIGLTLNPQILNIIVELVSRSIDVDTYIANTFNMVNR
ncbi:MAG: hypothetical protein LM582_06775 [Desulfurococcaceae archaeon]|nr:hypothetical protein [Desulfurococcaceae archaeon]